MSRVPILEPRAVPVSGVDAHLLAVDAQRLQAAALRQRFSSPPAWQPELAGDGGAVGLGDRPPAAAAVLLSLVDRPDGLQVLLTRRTDHLRHHAGQISLPGGKTEAEDAGPVATALREAEEEIGLLRRHVDVLGTLPLYTTVTSFQVTPVVALVDAGFELRLDPGEVAEVFEVPLQFLMTPAHHRRHVFVFAGGQRQFLSMPWTGHAGERDDFIWGATAAILRNFYRFLSA